MQLSKIDLKSLLLPLQRERKTQSCSGDVNPTIMADIQFIPCNRSPTKKTKGRDKKKGQKNLEKLPSNVATNLK